MTYGQLSAPTVPRVREVVYCTCSVRREENEDVVERALQLGGGARHRPFR